MTTNKVNGLIKKYCMNAIKYLVNIRNAIPQDNWDINEYQWMFCTSNKFVKKFNFKNKML